MKRLFLVLILLSMFFSCVCPQAPIKIMGFPDYNIKFDNFKEEESDLYNINEFLFFVLNIPFKDVKGWPNPEEVIKIGYTDCAGHAAVFSWLCYQYLDLKPYIYRLKKGKVTHQAVYIKEYNFKFNWIKEEKEWEIEEILSFKTYFYLVEYVK